MDNLSTPAEWPSKALRKGIRGKKSSLSGGFFRKKIYAMSADQRCPRARSYSIDAQMKGPTPLQSLSITGSEM